MKENEIKFLNFLKELEVNYTDSVTNISKTGEDNNFIESEKEMISFDEVAKDFAKDNFIEEYNSVDGLYYKIKEDRIIIYFFEFKKVDFLEENLLPRKRLNNIIKNIENRPLNENCEYEYLDELKKIKKEIYDRILVQLKMKPIESLFILYNLYSNDSGKHEDIINIEKHYYVVSETPTEYGPFTKNKSKNRRKGRSKEIFDFLFKLQPFPFKQTKSINEKSFIEIISSNNN